MKKLLLLLLCVPLIGLGQHQSKKGDWSSSETRKCETSQLSILASVEFDEDKWRVKKEDVVRCICSEYEKVVDSYDSVLLESLYVDSSKSGINNCFKEDTFYLNKDQLRIDEKGEFDPFISVVQMPLLGDCKDENCTQIEIMKFIARNFKLPEISKANLTEGRVILEFIVEKDGKVGRVKILRSLDKYVDKSAIKVVEKLPIFTPGRKDGEDVPVKYTVPIKCSLGEQYYENGQLMREFIFKGSKYSGVHKQYYENGQLMRESNYKDGHLNGPLKQYYENGQLMRKENYENGDLGREVKYKGGQRFNRIYCKYWDENGIRRESQSNYQTWNDDHYINRDIPKLVNERDLDPYLDIDIEY
jgi:TonB family protein